VKVAISCFFTGIIYLALSGLVFLKEGSLEGEKGKRQIQHRFLGGEVLSRVFFIEISSLRMIHFMHT
jgi:hypothetical protein